MRQRQRDRFGPCRLDFQVRRPLAIDPDVQGRTIEQGLSFSFVNQTGESVGQPVRNLRSGRDRLIGINRRGPVMGTAEQLSQLRLFANQSEQGLPAAFRPVSPAPDRFIDKLANGAAIARPRIASFLEKFLRDIVRRCTIIPRCGNDPVQHVDRRLQPGRRIHLSIRSLAEKQSCNDSRASLT